MTSCVLLSSQPSQTTCVFAVIPQERQNSSIRVSVGNHEELQHFSPTDSSCYGRLLVMHRVRWGCSAHLCTSRLRRRRNASPSLHWILSTRMTPLSARCRHASTEKGGEGGGGGARAHAPTPGHRAPRVCRV